MTELAIAFSEGRLGGILDIIKRFSLFIIHIHSRYLLGTIIPSRARRLCLRGLTHQQMT